MRHLPPARSVSHLLPEKADRRDVLCWKDSCRRVIRLFTALPPPRLQREENIDLKGHVLANSVDGEYVFCSKCYVCRRARDRKWIWLKECAHRDRDARALGETWEEQGHHVVLVMNRWKVTAQRPSLACELCHRSVWATAGFKEACFGVP